MMARVGVSSCRNWALVVMVSALLSGLGTVRAAEPEPIGVRVGEHDGFDRLVFDWNSPVGYRIEQRDHTVVITFDTPAEFDLIAVRRDPPPLVLGAGARTVDGEAEIRIDAAKPVSVRHFFSGPKVVLDLFDAPPDVVEPMGTLPKDVGGEETTPEEELSPEPVAREEARTGVSGQEDASGRLRVSASPIDRGVRLTLPWRKEVPAAVFSRVGYLWLVFGEPAQLDLSEVLALGGGIVSSSEQVDAAGATVLRLNAGRDRYAMMRRAGTAWELDIVDFRSLARTPLEVRRRNDGQIGVRVFLPVTGASGAVEFIDPEIGDLIVAVPLMDDGYGVLKERRYAEFHLLSSVQGVAIVPQSDRVYVTPGRDGIAISGADDLTNVEGTSGPEAKSVKPDPALFPSGDDQQKARSEPDRLIDFKSWRRGPKSLYRRNRLALLHKLATVPERDRTEARKALARFYVAHGFAAEAMGILSVMAKDDALMVDEPWFRALRGVTRTLMRRFGEAERDLDFSALIGDPHVLLWRALNAEAQGKTGEALTHYRVGRDVLWEYSTMEQARFRLAVARAAMIEKDYDLVRGELTELASVELPRKYATEAEYFRGQMYEVLEEEHNALVSYEKVIAANFRPTMARASLARTNVLLTNGTITREEAIDRLEALRFTWRGDDFEFSLLHRLGQLYNESGDHREGLTAIRMAITYFAKNEMTRVLALEMTDIFNKLFLEGGADKLSAVNALALYYDFRELTPIGAAGDEMIRRLSERLVGVDLLDRAAELLEHQITFRLNGAPQAQVAAQLAVIYLLDRKPALALDTLEKTRQPRLPRAVADRRRHLEVEALTRLKRFDEAEELLEQDESAEAMALRGDIYWSAQDWTRMAQHVRSQLGDRWSQARPLEMSERHQLLRLVVALALADNAEALALVRTRYASLMSGGKFYRSFDVITGKVDFDGLELRQLVGQLADVSTFQEFLASYRAEISGPAFSALN
ncbi:MAG: hypothetical protein ACE5EM_11840 [Sphingomonadales bacterium]